MARFGLSVFRELAKVPSSPTGHVFGEASLELSLLCGKDGSAFRTTLAPITGGYAIRSMEKVAPATDNPAQSSASEPAQTVKVGSISWTSEKCPCCGAKITPVRCGECEALVCDAAMSKRNGRAWFKCVPACGAEGEIEAGSIEAPARPASNPLMLPSGSAEKLAGPASSPRALPGRRGG
ncbi:MAG: hypothetical protein JO255_21620 [Alphaproteobacteria bacterium]|nr:hypothetical protein [Alphaproteobacteria bacterium]